MAHIAFISYSKNKVDAYRLCKYLETKDIKCWIAPRDAKDGTKGYPDLIPKAIRDCKAFLVILNKHSNTSEDVPSEVNIAKKNKKKIIPILSQDVDLSDSLEYLLGLRTRIYAFSKPFDSFFPEVLNEVRKITNQAPKKKNIVHTAKPPKTAIKKQKVVKVERKYLIPYGGQSLSLPCYFPSISSVKSNFSPVEYLEIINAVRFPQFLVSAYDVYNSTKTDKRNLTREIVSSTNRGAAVLFDSGGYEHYWKEVKHKKWVKSSKKFKQDLRNNWNISKFHKVLNETNYHFAFCYDVKHSSAGNKKMLINKIENQFLEDQGKSSTGSIIPIVHNNNKESLPEIISGVASRTNPMFIAVPERELGDSLLERANTILGIRRSLNQLNNYYVLHLLGTGNPRSILLFSICGADSFDGLEWCQTVVDHKTGLLHHLSQKELFDCRCDYCKDSNSAYHINALAHNLHFYNNWMALIQEALKKNNTLKVIEKYFSNKFISKMKVSIPEVFE